MTTSKPKNLSSFGEAAIALDQEFQLLERIAQKLENLSLQSEQGVERACQFIQEAEACRERLVAGMHTMAQALENGRERAEKAVQRISERANTLNARQKETQRLAERFQALGEMVKQVNSALAMLKPSFGGFSAEQQEVIDRLLPEFNEKMNILVTEARSLMEDAHKANLQAIERNADSLRQSLDAARSKLNQLAHYRRRDPNPALH